MRSDRRARVAVRIAVLLLVAGRFAVAAPTPDPPVVAVLPFSVHSAQPIDYLGASVANLIRTRLEASGQVAVVDEARVRDAVAGAAPDPTDAALRALAGPLGADFLVVGSLTELAGRYSLDVRVVPAAVGATAQTLVLTAQRDDELLDRVNEIADDVVQKVGSATPSVVARVEIVGGPGLERVLAGLIATKPGEPYDPSRVREDVAAMRGDPRIARVSSDTERGPDGVVVRFIVVPAGALAGGESVPPGTVLTVIQVDVRGNQRIEADAIRARIATRPGMPYSHARLSEDVREVYTLGFFRNVRVLSDPQPNGVIVIFVVEENPIVRQISIAGNDSVDGEKIRDILTLTTGSTLDQQLLFENRQRVVALYRAEGYFLAEVNYEVEPLTEGSVGIHFEVTEGDKLKLARIEFTGNTHFTDSELAQGFKTKRWRFWSIATSWFDKSGTYSEPLFLQDLRLVEKKYTDAGFLQVEIAAPQVVTTEGELVVTVAIVEGSMYSVGTIDLEGDITADLEELRDELLLKQGEVFNRSFLSEDVSHLTESYTNRGFYFANVSPLTNMSPQDLTVDVVYQVRKGPLYFVRQIDISGNTTTVDPVIRREIPVVEGQLYSQRAVAIGRARIQGTGHFEEVDFEMEPTDDPEQLDMNVAVVEKPTGSFSFGAGFSSQDSFVGTGSLSQSNLFGRGYAIQLSADVGAQTQRFFINFVDPYFLGSPWSLSTTAFRTRIQFEDFDQDQTGLDVVFGHALTEDNRGRGFVRYSFASRSLDDDDNVNAAAPIFREILGNNLTSSLAGLSFSLDNRDDRLAPTSGYQLGGSVEYSGIGFFSQFARIEGRFQYFFGVPSWLPFLSEKSTFVFGARAGFALPFNSIGDFDSPSPTMEEAMHAADTPQLVLLEDTSRDQTLPLSERYFLGGLGEFQLRGFKARSVGPRRPVLTRNLKGDFVTGGAIFRPVGRSEIDGACDDAQPPNTLVNNQGNGNGICNDIDDEDIDDFEDLDETDVIGGNKFFSTSFEYRFPISETLGLQGLVFLDVGNAWAEGDWPSSFDDFRFGTGGGVRWFSPFGPLAVVLGFPLDPLSVEDSPVFEFSVGGGGF